MAIEIGAPAPDFCLDAADGRLCLSELRGQWVVLYFYSKDATSAWTAEALDFSARLPQFAALNAVVLGVSKDSVASHARFAAKNDLAVRLLADPEQAVLKLYDVLKPKKMYGKDVVGTVRTTLLIDPAGIVRRAWTVKKVEGHADEVLAALTELAAQP